MIQAAASQRVEKKQGCVCEGWGACGGLGPVWGRQKGLSVLAVCCGNTAADS